MDDPVLEYKILEAVHDKEGSVTQRHISEKIGRSVASVNFALRLLAVKGYIKISGASPRSLKYHLTPSGVLQKSILAYNFFKRQSDLYEHVRNGMLHKLKELQAEGITRVALYGWTPFTESVMLYLMSEGIGVTALYVEEPQGIEHVNRIPVKPISAFCADCEILVLMEPLVDTQKILAGVRQVVCFPVG
jgi:Mn-dependent DtxR family transcriptional regulator